MFTKKGIVQAAAALWALMPANALHADTEQHIRFAGYEWAVKSSESMGPGPNIWKPENVRVDSKGRLHLRITNLGGKWQCAEVRSLKRFGFGTYGFEVENTTGDLDRNVVLGLFNYPTADVGPDGTHEIDIEIARWGQDAAPAGNFTVWPAKEGEPHGSRTFQIPAGAKLFTHQFKWQTDRVAFASSTFGLKGKPTPLDAWSYRPENSDRRISQDPESVLINFWLFRGMAPADGKEAEVVIRSFQFTAAGASQKKVGHSTDYTPHKGKFGPSILAPSARCRYEVHGWFGD